jgi:hypothetical protein
MALTVSSKRRFATSVWLLLVAAGAGACGGRVVVDDTIGAGGAPPAGTTTSSVVGSGGAGGAGGTTVDAACAAFCNRMKADGCETGTDTCPTWCPDSDMDFGPCLSAWLDVISCEAAVGFEDPFCDTPKACRAKQRQLMACMYPAGPCKVGECHSEGKHFICDEPCGGSIYETDCVYPPGTCACRLDGQLLATCEGDDGVGYCCTPYFAASK